MHLFQKKFSELSLWTPLWLVSTIFGSPIYNLITYYLCLGFGYYFEINNHVSQVKVVHFVIILLIVFVMRYIIYRIIYVVRLADQMTTPFYIEVFCERHRFQLIGLPTFWMWARNIAEDDILSIQVPISLVLSLTVSLFTINRLFRLGKYLNTLKG